MYIRRQQLSARGYMRCVVRCMRLRSFSFYWSHNACVDWIGLDDIVCNVNILSPALHIVGIWHIDRSNDLAPLLYGFVVPNMRAHAPIQRINCKAPHILSIEILVSFHFSFHIQPHKEWKNRLERTAYMPHMRDIPIELNAQRPVHDEDETRT